MRIETMNFVKGVLVTLSALLSAYLLITPESEGEWLMFKVLSITLILVSAELSQVIVRRKRRS